MCFKPIYVKSKSQYYPCNRCPKCRAKRVSQWSFRLLQEEKVCQSSSFITITYDNESVPITPLGYLGLRKRHLQLFFKRLRKAHGDDIGVNSKGIIAGINNPIKYYAVGEYGGRTERPHYHIILYNCKLELIQDAWTNTWTDNHAGKIHYGKVEGASIGYTLKYLMKKRKKIDPKHDDREREFSLISKGLGISYLTESMANWHVEDLINNMYCTLPGGVKIPMPRYYKDKLYFELEKAAIAAAYTEQINIKDLEKLEKQTPLDIWNEQQAIDAAYDRMYKSTFKTKI